MAVTMRGGLAAWAAMLGMALPMSAQDVVRGVVLAREGESPVTGATVAALRTKASRTTDRQGRFSLPVAAEGDTLVVAAIGWRPDTVVVAGGATGDLRLLLDRAPVIISDLIATGHRTPSLDLSGLGQWRMPLEAARTVPAAIETDVFRSLVLIPAVSFSSPLSARPLVRGYDAQEVATRVDGFEMVNLYHLGRLFSAVPADAVEEVTVSPAPFSGSLGGSTAGVIDLTGRTGHVGRVRGGGGMSLGSIAGYAGGGSERVRVFGAARAFHLKSLEALTEEPVPYHFEDVYLSAAVGAPARPRLRLTLFGTWDGLGAEDDRSTLRWGNVLVGARVALLDRGGLRLDGSVHTARFSEHGTAIPSLTRGEADMANRFARTAAALDLEVTRPRWRLGFGASAGWREVRNDVRSDPRGAGAIGFTPRSSAFDLPEGSVYGEASAVVGPLTLQAGARLDASNGQAVLQPRFQARTSLHPRLQASVGVGRTARLHHLVSDPRSEPDLEFLEFWLTAGEEGVPLPSIDHAALNLDVDFAPLVGRLSLFGSRGRGIGEMRPPSDQRLRPSGFFRFGDTRTHGIEAQLAWRPQGEGRSAFSVSYVWQQSERRWDDRWVRWSEDRRHTLRAFGQLRYRTWDLFGSLDAMTGPPITPIIGFTPFPPGQTGPPFTGGRKIYGPEHSGATSGTFRVDLGFQHRFGGPWGSRLVWGGSLLNLGVGAPIVEDGEHNPVMINGFQYGRLFPSFPIPTFTLRLEF